MLQVALDAALFGAVDQPTSHLVVDLAGVTFCSARGFELLADTAQGAATSRTGYALSGCSTHLKRCWRILATDHPYRDNSAVSFHVSVAAAVIAIRAGLPTQPPA